MHHLPSLLWNLPLNDLKSQLQDCVDLALDQVLTQARLPMPVQVFFRADDIGVPGKQLFRMLDLFADCRAPLCLAVVPSWMNRHRWEIFAKINQKMPDLLCWHQHGWRHVTHETEGKKQEFGPVRSIAAIQKDIVRGREKLELLMSDQFTPVFTPPWNRCDGRTLALIKINGFKAVSRHRHSMPRPPKGLPDFAVNVDLHTRRETSAEAGWQALWKELSAAISSGTCGIMIHHQQMNESAFEFLKVLLEVLLQRSHILPTHFKNMLHA